MSTTPFSQALDKSDSSGISDGTTRLRLLLITCLIGASLILIVRSMLLGYDLARPVPFMDQWEFVKQIPLVLGHKISVWDLIGQHNEHRILTSRVLFILDTLLFDCSSYSCIALVYGLCLVVTSMFARLAERDWMLPWLLLSSLALSPAQFENLAGGFQVSFPLLQVCAIGSLWCLVRYATEHGASRVYLLLSMLFDVLAVFTLASGVLLFVPLVWISIVYRRAWRRILPSVAFHSVATIGFFHGYTSVSGIEKSFEPLRVAEFSVRYLGSGLRDYGPIGLVAGVVSVLLLAQATAKLTRRSLRQASVDPHQVIAVALGLFTVAGAVVTGIGRVSMGMEAANASRYAFFSFAMISTLYVFYWRESNPQRSPARILIWLTLMTVSVASNMSSQSVAQWRQRIRTIDSAGFALANGVWSDETLSSIYPLPASIREPLRFLADHRLAVFSSRFASMYAPPLNAVQDIGASTSACDIHVDSLARTGPNWIELTASISAESPSTWYAWVLAFDHQRHLLGYGRPGSPAIVSPSNAVGFDIDLNAAELANVGKTSVSFVLVPRSIRRHSCRAEAEVDLPPLSPLHVP